MVRCQRCGFTQPAPDPLPGHLAAVCPQCMCLIVRELGEMTSREDRADPESWGDVGWQ